MFEESKNLGATFTTNGANNVKEAYVKNGYAGDFTSDKFVRLILKPSEGDIHNFALAYQMDYSFLRVFRKKILKKS